MSFIFHLYISTQRHERPALPQQDTEHRRGQETQQVREAAKKVIFFSGPVTKRGGGKGMGTKKKELLFEKIPPKNVTTKLEGWG